jgi:peptidoglycan/LPS O-acetylase OafA/YrhL
MISFASGIMAINDYPKAAFYFPLCRFWQMSIGGIIAYKKIAIKNLMINNILSILGTIAILIATCIINEKSLFPGWWALIPTLSSACILQAGPSAFVNKYILSTKLFVFIGKISYPLYLWHWPLLVFSRKLYPLGSKSIFGNILFIVFLSVVLSIITYYLIENQLRFRKSKKVVISLVLAMLIIGITGASIIYS